MVAGSRIRALTPSKFPALLPGLIPLAPRGPVSSTLDARPLDRSRGFCFKYLWRRAWIPEADSTSRHYNFVRISGAFCSQNDIKRPINAEFVWQKPNGAFNLA